VENICSFKSQIEDRVNLSNGPEIVNETLLCHFESLQVPPTILHCCRSSSKLWADRDIDKPEFLSDAWVVYMVYRCTERFHKTEIFISQGKLVAE
jgi:hypothetical protein